MIASILLDSKHLQTWTKNAKLFIQNLLGCIQYPMTHILIFIRIIGTLDDAIPAKLPLIMHGIFGMHACYMSSYEQMALDLKVIS